MKTTSKRTHAAFALDILRSDIKLYSYPLLRIVAMLVLLAVMWPLMFNISPLGVAEAVDDLTSAAVGQAISKEAISAAEQKRLSSEAQNVFQHMHVGYCLLFVVINVLIGVFSVGALTGQSLAVVRGEQRGFGYGYVVALKRFPQLFMWWLVTIVIGFFLSLVRSIKYVGPLIAMLLGMAWAVLTFFSITAIMATGCGPIRAIGDSKKTIVDAWKKISDADESQMSDLSKLRRGFYVGLPLVILNMVLVLSIFALLFFDFRTLTQGSHHLSLGAIGALVIVLYTNGAIVSALWAVVKSTVYVWAEEGRLPASVDESVMDHAFIGPGHTVAGSH